MGISLPILRRSTSANFHVRRIHLCRAVVRRPRRDGAITQSRHRYCRHSRRAMLSRDRDTPSALGSSVPRNAGRRGGRGFITSNSMPSRRQPAMGVARLRACEPTTGITRCVTITASFGTRATETPRHRSPADERRARNRCNQLLRRTTRSPAASAEQQ